MEDLKDILEIRQKIVELDALQKKALQPMLENIAYLPILLDWFHEIYLTNSLSRYNVSGQRNLYICVIVMLYSPGTLIGDRLKIGLRDALAEQLLISAVAISNILQSVCFYYHQYTAFKKDANYIYAKILAWAKELGYDKTAGC